MKTSQNTAEVSKEAPHDTHKTEKFANFTLLQLRPDITDNNSPEEWRRGKDD